MEATSITQTTNTIIELVAQPLSEKIKEVEFQIQDSLVHGEIHATTQIIRKLAIWFEDLIWKSYLTSLLQCEIIMSWLRALGAKKGFRLISYQQIWVTLPTGTKIQIRSPFFVKASPKRGRKRRGPQNRGEHLFLSLMGFVHKVEPGLAFRAVKLAVLTPSFDIASKILAQEGIKLSSNKIRQMVTAMGPDDLSSRVERLLGDNRHYLTRLGIKEACEVIVVGDGAPWIWERIPNLLKATGVNSQRINEVIDWTHAKQNLNKAFGTLSKKKMEKVDFNHFKNLLFEGKIRRIVDEVKSLLNVRATSKIIKKLKSYFVSNESRMQYAAKRAEKFPIGSGVIESAIRRVINMRVKSPGSFWKLCFAETVIYLRAQLLYGRWENLTANWTKAIASDFRTISMTAAMPANLT